MTPEGSKIVETAITAKRPAFLVRFLQEMLLVLGKRWLPTLLMTAGSGLGVGYFWPHSIWELESGRVLVDGKQTTIPSGSVKLIWPRYFWERYEIDGLEGGTVDFVFEETSEVAGADAIVGRLACRDHQGNLAPQALLTKCNSNIVKITAKNGKGDVWDLKFATHEEFVKKTLQAVNDTPHPVTARFYSAESQAQSEPGQFERVGPTHWSVRHPKTANWQFEFDPDTLRSRHAVVGALTTDGKLAGHVVCVHDDGNKFTVVAFDLLKRCLFTCCFE